MNATSRIIPIFIAGALALGTLGLSAQTPASPGALVFEAASVKPNKEGGTSSSIRRQPGGRLSATNMPLRALITFSYQIQGFQLVEAPGWIADERFDIVAKIEGDPPPVPPGSGPDPHMVAMRTLLADRFKLRVRRETRELDIYALVKARPDGALGPALRQHGEECTRVLEAAIKSGGTPPSGPDAPFCGARQNAGRILFGGMPLSFFANSLSGQVGRYVVDRTGLTGDWDFELTYQPELRGPVPPGVEPPQVDPNAPSLFTAIQEQLGLKLESTKGPVEVLVVEAVERPVSD